MKIRILSLAAAMLLTLTWSADAQQRPLVTEDPETIGAGRVLVEGGVAFGTDQTHSAYGLEGDVRHIGQFGVSVGVGPTAEVQVDGGLIQQLQVTRRTLGTPAVATPLVVGDTASSFEDLIIATKIRLRPESDTRPAIGLRFGTKLPTADPEKGVGLGTTDFFASFLLAKTVQSVRTVGNVGLVVLGDPTDAQDSAPALTFGVSVARALTDAFEVVGEVNGRLDAFGDVVPPGLESRGIFRLAGRYTYAMLRLDFGMLAGITNRDPGFGVTAGATYVITR